MALFAVIGSSLAALALLLVLAAEMSGQGYSDFLRKWQPAWAFPESLTKDPTDSKDYGLGSSVNSTVSVPAPFGSIGCSSGTNGGNWVFGRAGGTWHSCSSAARSDGAYMCGNDPASIFVDLANNRQKSGCFVWQSRCTFDLLRVSSLTFDLDIRGCGSVWAAPLWMSPTPWHGPGYQSGEIDMVEMCPVGQVRTNFAGPGGQGEHQAYLGDPNNFGAKKYTMTWEHGTGSISTRICAMNGQNCVSGAYYKNFFQQAGSTRGKRSSYPYHLISDIWNGYGGDQGWKGCHARNDPGSRCQYAIKNIKFHTTDNRPLFNGVCSAMNGNGPQPAPGPAPPPYPPSGPCRDTDPNCVFYRSKGYCSTVDNVKRQCRKTCGLCGATCQDTDPNCVFYRSKGYCSWVDNVKRQCKKTCGLCPRASELVA